MRNHRARAGLALTLSVGLVVITGCGSDETDAGQPASTGGGNGAEATWEDVVAAANEEGRVNFYSVAPPAQNDRLIQAFNEEYPEISVSLTRGAGELPGRVEGEIQSQSDGADVFFYSDPQFFVNQADNLLDVNGPNVEGWSDDFWAEEGKAIIPTKYPWTVLVWNTDMFPDGFENWPDLLESDVEGRIGIYKVPTVSNCATLAFMEENLGEDYITELGQQNGRYYPSTVPMIQAIGSGEVGVGMLAAPVAVWDLQNQGAPVDYTFPEPGFALMWGGGAIATSKRPNAARVFVDFTMSEAGQEALNGDELGTAGRDGVNGAIPDLDGWTMFDASECSNPEAISETEQQLNTYYP